MRGVTGCSDLDVERDGRRLQEGGYCLDYYEALDYNLTVINWDEDEEMMQGRRLGHMHGDVVKPLDVRPVTDPAQAYAYRICHLVGPVGNQQCIAGDPITCSPPVPPPSPPPPSPPMPQAVCGDEPEPEPSPSPGPHSGCVSSARAADSFNFLNAHLGHSNLGGVGPDRFADRNILYKKVGTTAAGVPFDMRVENLSPYRVNNAKINTLTASGLAEINLLGPKKGQGLEETFVELEFCFLEEDTTIPVTLSGFQLTFFDFDQSNSRSDECLSISDHDSYTLSEQTEIVVTDMGGGRTEFCSSRYGEGNDNPSSPHSLTAEQRNRAVTLSFSNKKCITLTYSISCCITTGRNFLFAGSSKAMLPTCGESRPAPVAPLPEAEELVTTIEQSLISGSASGQCVPKADSFNFKHSHLGHSNLGGVGPHSNVDETILYKSVGITAAGVPFNMQVENLSPYAVNKAEINTLTASGLAEINLLGPKKGQGLDETFVELQFCFLNEQTGEPVRLSRFELTFFDFDQSVRPPRMPSLHRHACPHCPAHAHTHAHAHAPPCPLRVRSHARVLTRLLRNPNPTSACTSPTTTATC